MKRNYLLPFLLLAVASAAVAQLDMRVHRAALMTGEAVQGKLILLPETLAFLDDEQPNASVAVAKSAIASLTAEGDGVTLQLTQAVRDRAGRSNRLIVRLESAAETASVQRWWSGTDTPAAGAAATAAGAAATAAADAEVLTFSAQRNKRLRGNTDGKLIVDAERIIFESTDKASDSRRWELKEIRELKLKNPYTIEVRTFRGEKYKLALSGQGMDNSEFREIERRVIEARTSR